MPIPMPVRQWMIQEGQDADFIARRGSKIGFTVDDRFVANSPASVVFKITFYDGVKGEWNLVCRDNSGEKKYGIRA